jgi:hypothetical protein
MFCHETGFGSNLLFGSRYYFYLNNSEPWCAGVNILALALFALLLRELFLGTSDLKTNQSELSNISEQQRMTEMHPNYSWRN